jgi:restriction system protein
VLLDEDEYELPLLQTLVQLGGRAPTSEVLDGLEPKIIGKLSELDKELIATGTVRWRNRAQFVRLTLVKRGDMVEKTPRGIWEISDKGRLRLEKAR